MPYPSYQPPSSSRIIGIAFVVVLHLALIYALINALAHRSVEVSHAPIETKIIDETPPAKVEQPPPPPVLAPPPPPFVPPPEVNVEPQSTISAPTAITTTKPAGPTVAPVLPHVDEQHSRQPAYPAQSRELGEQGSVVLQVLVDVDGKALESKLVQSSGFDRLDQAALADVKIYYRFVPGMVGGKPQQMWYKFKFTWKLR